MSFSHRLPNVSRRCADLNLVVFWLDGETTLPEGIVVTTTWFHVSLQMINIRCSIVALISFVMHLSISNASKCCAAMRVGLLGPGLRIRSSRKGGSRSLGASSALLAAYHPTIRGPELARDAGLWFLYVQTSQECETALTSQIWSIMETDRRSVRGSVKESIKGSAIRPVICIVMRSVTELIFSIQSCHEVSKITQLS